jgi:RNA polymerase sigma-70 factor (ECF subfamily)
MPPDESPTEALLKRAGRGDYAARELLFAGHRARLRRMVAVRIDGRLAARIDPSDVVQETLLEASRKLSEYLRDPSVPFYPWLRQLAWKRLYALSEKHIHSQKRSIMREERYDLPLSDNSVQHLADRLMSSGTSPSHRVLRAELLERVRIALDRLSSRDREVLVMRHLEQMSIREIAATLGIDERAAKQRQTRAIVRLQGLMADESGEGRRQ